jgi:hypothetical protein
VLVWLGLAKDGSQLAIETIESIHQRYEAGRKAGDEFPPQGHTQFWPSHYGNQYTRIVNRINDLPLRDLQEPRWRALLALLKRRYWQRMWIVQELQLARRLTFYCGAEKMSDIALKDVCEFIASASENELRLHLMWEDMPIADHFKELKKTFAINLFGRRHTLPNRPSLRLKTWLYDCMRLECTCSEPRDMVYALLGVSEDCQEGELVPDYGKSDLEVYYDAMTVCTRDPPIPEINDHWLVCKLHCASISIWNWTRWHGPNNSRYTHSILSLVGPFS